MELESFVTVVELSESGLVAALVLDTWTKSSAVVDGNRLGKLVRKTRLKYFASLTDVAPIL